VVAYDVLKAIYLERGYRVRDIPRLILEKNLYGLDIDDRAAQMAGFALLMKARADDRRLFTATDDAGNQPPKLNVLSLQESKGLNVDELATHLAPHQVQRATIAALVEAFEHAKTFGSLIQIPYALKTHLAVLPQVLAKVRQSGDMYASAAADDLLELVQQAQVLAMQFDAVVANPPYMGGKYLTPVLKKYLKDNYDGFEKDLFSSFMIRNLALSKDSGQLGFMSPFVWMFISSYEELRTHFIDRATLTSLVQLEYSGFDGATVPICTFTLGKQHVAQFVGSYVRLSDFRGADHQGPKTLEAIQNKNCGWFYTAKPDDFKKIPGSPIAYWISENTKRAFREYSRVGDVASPKKGLDTGENERFLRLWHEVSQSNIFVNCKSAEESRKSERTWYPINRGGEFRKWFGNNDYVINWKANASEIRNTLDSSGKIRANLRSENYYFSESVTWGAISSAKFSARYCDPGALFGAGGYSVFSDRVTLVQVMGLFSSVLANHFLEIISPTLNFEAGNISSIPFKLVNHSECENYVNRAVSISRTDWNSFESSWGFECSPLMTLIKHEKYLNKSFDFWAAKKCTEILDLSKIESDNNKLFLSAYGLQDELPSEVPESEITLARADREKDCQRLISYAIGCMMGRYSLDEPGLIYAHAGNVGFDASRYTRFAADADGILPITDEHWFDDDAPARVRDFLQVVWGPETLAENMAWLAESLGGKASETPEETIRRYMADKFYKDHLQTYKKRPIYWLFSSGKQGAFQALVYLHRYNEGTLSRMRAEYVIPLTTKLATRLEMLEQDANASSSAAARTKIRKQIEGLRKKQVELLSFDEKLRHHADMRISLDLDDGVKVNYGKFGDLLDGVKVVTGGAGDE
jgi:type II restriction/modification system DNA methylase subunit YeeA